MTDSIEVIDEMDYAGLMQTALRGVIRDALRKIGQDGLPGKHHFYISFLTMARGVDMPHDILARYPHDITIVFNPDQYRELVVHEDFFEVVLSFGGLPRNLSVPFAAITRFYDPAVKFVLEFEFDESDVLDASGTEGEDMTSEERSVAPTPEMSDSPKVISLEQFRKK